MLTGAHGIGGDAGDPATHHPPPTTLKIVPKGLRSFDAHDADFFLELLPGPRDRDGLLDSIRFWKTRIEERDPDSTFAVGLLYGPSGCGKSSLVKAGLVPRLAEDVLAVYVEATAADTEARLRHGLRKRRPDLPATLSLKEVLAALRGGRGAKVLIILDQFEQWLHASKDERNTELVQALRQCDGTNVQCLVLVRDDFWMGSGMGVCLLLEWCQGRYVTYKAGDDKEDNLLIGSKYSRVLRGGSFLVQASGVRSANRNYYLPAGRTFNVGFRAARTFTTD